MNNNVILLFFGVEKSMYVSKRINLLGMNQKQLKIFFNNLGEQSFRAYQLMKWIYHHYYDNFDQMTNFSKSLRKKLYQIAEIRAPVITKTQISLDSTIKWSMQVEDQQIETVYIPEKMRSTLCISSQVGCALGCRFCGTAKQGFNRNLSTSEIIGQVWRINKFIKYHNDIEVSNNIRMLPITNIVLMGMGEPLLNLVNVVSAIRIILDGWGFGLSRKRVILSTAGIVPAIDKLKDMIDISLAISLHAPNDTIRDKIMPINQKYNINSLLSSVRRYLKGSRSNRRRITIEYVLLDHINDEISHAHQLASELKNIPCKVNLIPWNVIPDIQYTCSTHIRIREFLKVLLQYGIVTVIRKIRGADINAACGQLTGDVVNRIKINLV